MTLLDYPLNTHPPLTRRCLGASPPRCRVQQQRQRKKKRPHWAPPAVAAVSRQHRPSTRRCRFALSLAPRLTTHSAFPREPPSPLLLRPPNADFSHCSRHTSHHAAVEARARVFFSSYSARQHHSRYSRRVLRHTVDCAYTPHRPTHARLNTAPALASLLPRTRRTALSRAHTHPHTYTETHHHA